MLPNLLGKLLKKRDALPEDKKGYFLFNTIGQVMKCEKLCIKNGVTYNLRPVPRNLSSECGICLQTNLDSISKMQSLIEKNGIEYKKICCQ